MAQQIEPIAIGQTAVEENEIVGADRQRRFGIRASAVPIHRKAAPGEIAFQQLAQIAFILDDQQTHGVMLRQASDAITCSTISPGAALRSETITKKVLANC